MNVLWSKLKEVLSSVFPIIVLVLILHFTLTPIPGVLLARFLIGAVAMILGLSILLIGVDLGFLPFGSHMGSSFIKSNKMMYIIVVGFLLGFLINFAEPDLHVLAIQVADALNNIELKDIIRIVVAIGTGILLLLGIIRIVKGFSLRIMFIIIYGVSLIVALTADPKMFAIGFDASGAATGVITVPLVLALSLGVSSMKRETLSAEEDSFGLVGIMASGAIIGVLVLNLFIGGDIAGSPPDLGVISPDAELTPVGEVIRSFRYAVLGDGITPGAIEKTFIGMLPIIIMLIVFQIFKFHLRKAQFIRIIVGFVYTFVGIVLFFIGVNAGFLDVGKHVGSALSEYDNKLILVGFGFLLGMVAILTEPAVHVLTHQIEDVTSGYVKRKTVLVALAIGVATAVGLAMLRVVVPGIMLWHILVPGFVLALSLTFFVPKVFVGIAFDSGGVASGPMAATFVLAFARGAAEAVAPDPTDLAAITAESFGVIALIAMTPLIALQLLGLIYKIKSKKSEV